MCITTDLMFNSKFCLQNSCVNTESSGLPVSVQQNISETIVSNISTENYVTSTIDRGNDAPILTDDWIALILSGVLFIIACLLCCYLCRLKKKRAGKKYENNLIDKCLQTL